MSLKRTSLHPAEPNPASCADVSFRISGRIDRPYIKFYINLHPLLSVLETFLLNVMHYVVSVEVSFKVAIPVNSNFEVKTQN